MTEVGVKRLLRRAISKAGGIDAWAAAHEMSAAHVYSTLNGHRQIAGSVLSALGLRRVVRYEYQNERVGVETR